MPSVLIFLFLCVFGAHHVLSQVTRLQYPTINSVTPSFGSVEGGTWITITGVNFMASEGLFTNRVILLAGQVCQEVTYYTTAQRIICIAPKCVEPACLSDPNWQGSVTVSLDVYIQDVETILSASSTFVYHGGYTPEIFAMTKNIRGSTVASLTGRTSTDTLSDIQIKVGPLGNRAYLGDPGEINPTSMNMWSTNQPVYYTPPEDLTAGFYNLTFQSQDDQSHGSRGTGFARMYTKQPAYDNWGFPYYYLWDSSLLGNVYNVQLQPVISTISPPIGSIAGGTLVTITGSGFSKTLMNNMVFVGGLPCDVRSADFTKITCITRSHTTVIDAVEGVSFENPEGPWMTNVTRRYGSPGWWVQLWNLQDYNTNNMNLASLKVSFGWRSEMSFGLYYYISSSWASLLGYSSNAYDPLTYAAYLSTELIPPFSGYYRFYVNNDDTSSLFISFPGNKTEEFLFTAPYSSIDDLLSNGFGSHMTKDVYLTRGVRVRVRSLLRNNGGPDFLRIGLRLAPDFSDSSNFEPAPGVSSMDWQISNFSLEALHSPEFLHHHSLKTMQIVSLNIFYQREIQVRGQRKCSF